MCEGVGQKSYSEKEIQHMIDHFKGVGDRPTIIEVLGTPNTGKTTAIRMLASLLQKSNVKVDVIYEAARQCKIKKKYSPEFNYWTAAETIKQLIRSIDENNEIIICERGILDAVTWMKVYTMDHLISEDQYKVLCSYYTYARWMKLLKYAVAMKCSAEAAIKRESIEGLVYLEGNIINRRVLEMYNHALEETLHTLNGQIRRCTIIDTSQMKFKEATRCLISTVLTYLEDAKE